MFNRLFIKYYSDNVELNIGSGGKIIATDEIGSVQHELVKVEFGDPNSATQVSASNPLPVTDAVAEAALASIAAEDFATSANQSTEIAGLAAILAKLSSDPATQTTLAAILAKIIASPATEATLAALSAKITNPLPVSGTVTVDTSLLATSAKQDTGNTSLASIKTNTDKIPSQGQALAAASTPVVLTAAEEAILSAILTITDFDTKTGSLTETAPATDTASSGLNGRLQRIAQRLTSLITALGSPFQAGGSIANTSFASTVADGGNVVEGALADAIVAAGATGSISAKLRRATQGLEDLKTLIVLAAGTAIIGKIGIDQTTPGTTNAVQITNSSITTTESVPTTIFNGKTTVTTAGTRVTLAASQAIKSVTIKALSINTGFIYVGNATVAASNGYQLLAGDSISMDIANLNTVNIDSSINGEGVSYFAVN